MNRSTTPDIAATLGVPRKRGDEPRGEIVLDESKKRSPQTRG